MKDAHADYWMKQFDAETVRRVLAGRKLEAEAIEDAERARDGLPPIDRPFVETPIAEPKKRTGRPAVPPDPLRPEIETRHPNSAICQIVQLWREGKIT